MSSISFDEVKLDIKYKSSGFLEIVLKILVFKAGLSLESEVVSAILEELSIRRNIDYKQFDKKVLLEVLLGDIDDK